VRYISTKSQVWYLDYIIGIFIFTICILLFFKFIPNIDHQELDSINEVYLDARTVSNSLATAGYPNNWTNETVERIGITNGNNVISSEKLKEFKKMVDTDYKKTRTLFNLRSDYVVYFTDKNDKPTNLSGIHYLGHSDVTFTNNKIDISGIDHSDLVALTRVLIYNGTAAKMVIYTWY